MAAISCTLSDRQRYLVSPSAPPFVREGELALVAPSGSRCAVCAAGDCYAERRLLAEDACRRIVVRPLFCFAGVRNGLDFETTKRDFTTHHSTTRTGTTRCSSRVLNLP